MVTIDDLKGRGITKGDERLRDVPEESMGKVWEIIEWARKEIIGFTEAVIRREGKGYIFEQLYERIYSRRESWGIECNTSEAEAILDIMAEFLWLSQKAIVNAGIIIRMR